MKRSVLSWVIVLAAILSLSLAGCAMRLSTQAEIDKLHDSVERAIGAGAKRLAPESTALAEVYLHQAQVEFDEWDDDVDDYLARAREKVREVWRIINADILRNVYFDFNISSVRRDAGTIRTLDGVVAWLRSYPRVHLSVEGHADEVGSLAYNMRLSQKRAEAVTSSLVKKGISPHRLHSASYGEERPAASNRTDPGRQLNRRVEFKVIE